MDQQIPDPHEQATTRPEHITFTRAQTLALDKVFPEFVGSHLTKPEQFYVQAGMRAVLAYIRSKTV